MRVATYNVHDCVGRDGRIDPARVAKVIAELQADLVALQEITLDPAGELVGQLQAATRLRAIDGTLFERGVGRYGNIVLVRDAVLETRLHDLARDGREPRGAVEVRVEHRGAVIGLLATHLGLDRGERRWQLRRLGQRLDASAELNLVMGDLNAWNARLELAPLFRRGLSQRPVRSFPTWPFAALPLDRILVREPARLRRCWRHESNLARIASDHFPVLAELETTA